MTPAANRFRIALDWADDKPMPSVKALPEEAVSGGGKLRRTSRGHRFRIRQGVRIA